MATTKKNDGGYTDFQKMLIAADKNGCGESHRRVRWLFAYWLVERVK